MLSLLSFWKHGSSISIPTPGNISATATWYGLQLMKAPIINQFISCFYMWGVSVNIDNSASVGLA